MAFGGKLGRNKLGAFKLGLAGAGGGAGGLTQSGNCSVRLTPSGAAGGRTSLTLDTRGAPSGRATITVVSSGSILSVSGSCTITLVTPDLSRNAVGNCNVVLVPRGGTGGATSFTLAQTGTFTLSIGGTAGFAFAMAGSVGGTIVGILNLTPSGGVPPLNLTAPTLSGQAIVGGVLQTNGGTWSGNPTPALAYQWQRSANGVSGWTDIPNALQNEYAIVDEDVGFYLRVRVVAMNAGGTATANSAATAAAVVVYAPPAAIAPTVTVGGVTYREPAPTIKIEIAFDTDTHAATQIWTDVTEDFIGCETERGRQFELDRYEAGTMVALLKDRAGKYDPANGSSPYAGKVKPMKMIRVKARYPSTRTYPTSRFQDDANWRSIYTGYIERWEQERRGPLGMRAKLTCTDGFELLTQAQVNPLNDGSAFFAAQHCDDRIRAALADAGWPATRKFIATGNVNIQAATYDTGTALLSVIQDAADAEFPGIGVFFMSANGIAAFWGRKHRFRTQVHYEFGDDGARAGHDERLPYKQMHAALSKDELVNSCVCYPAGAEPGTILNQRVQAAASVAKYGRRDRDFPDLLVLSGDDGKTAIDETRLYAQYYVNNYKEPTFRISQLELAGAMATARATTDMWDFLLECELGDRIKLWSAHPGGGGAAGLDFYVEGIRHKIGRDEPDDSPYRWDTALDLSPAAYWTPGLID